MNPVPDRPESDKVRQMFSQVAAKYDQANNILSFGIHHLWRKKLVEVSGAKMGMKILDCATGTGDLAIEFKKKVGSLGEVTGADFCVDMLTEAPIKAQKKNLQIHFEVADVTQLYYPSQRFDICSIAFGIRNVENPEKAIQEMARVVKPGGVVMILEFGQSSFPVFSHVYNFYSQMILPKIGGLVTGQKQAYEYLQKSSALFPSGSKFVELMQKTDAFDSIESTPLTGGIAYIYKGLVKS